MTVDSFQGNSDSVTASARQAFTVVSSDAVELAFLPKALYIGTGGTLVVRAIDSAADVTFKNVASGQILDIRARFVRATGTTATDIVALA